tara:strand:+ start:610 stop:1146 length:537 start_codon:yes stop_codon:yes gene_type:complete
MQELAKVVDEDALVSKDGIEKDAHIRGDLNLDYPLGEGEMCEQCGSEEMYEGECMECGYQGGMMLQEGNCGCSSAADDGTDYSIDTMGMIRDALGVMTHSGYDANTSKVHHFDDKHHHNNYMAKPALYKVAKYAQKLLHIIPDGYELDDWQRTKIAQISDDIGEVYHSLDYDFHETED